MQSQSYRDQVLPEAEWLDSMICANQGRHVVRDWILDRRLERYAMTPDFDNRWRTGGSVTDVVEESHLDIEHLKEGIQRFVARG